VLDLESLKSLLPINRFQLIEQMSQQPPLFSRVCELHQAQWDALGRAKTELLMVEAELDMKVRVMLEQKKWGTNQWVMEQEVQAAMHREPRWLAAHQKVNDEYSLLGRISGLKEAFAQRKDMLTTISANVRQELAQTGTADPSLQRTVIETTRK